MFHTSQICDLCETIVFHIDTMPENRRLAHWSMEKAEVDELRELTQRVCENVTAYVGAQLDGSLESMQLMETVVNNINSKYMSMKREAKSFGKLSKVLEARANAMAEKVTIIDEIDEELTELEDMVDQLEQYTGSLEVKFNDLR